MLEERHSLRLGEVIETTSTEFVAEAYQLAGAPALGALVRTGDEENCCYAATYFVQTAGIDPGRRPIARGRERESEQEIFDDHPELNQLLRTEFRALLIAHRQNGRLSPWLPAAPPRLHGFVYECNLAEVIEVTNCHSLLRSLLFSSVKSGTDELVGAFVRHGARARAASGEDRQYCIDAGRELATMLGADPQRLNALLLRIKP